MRRVFLRNVIALVIVAGGMLAILDGSDHHSHVLPADASPIGVFPAALLTAGILAFIETRHRRHREHQKHPADHPEHPPR
jgi:hypothetical protein